MTRDAATKYRTEYANALYQKSASTIRQAIMSTMGNMPCSRLAGWGNWRPPSIQTRISKIRPFALSVAKVPLDKDTASRTASSLLYRYPPAPCVSAVTDWIYCHETHPHLERISNALFEFPSYVSLCVRFAGSRSTRKHVSEPSLPCPVTLLYMRLRAPITDAVRETKRMQRPS